MFHKNDKVRLPVFQGNGPVRSTPMLLPSTPAAAIPGSAPGYAASGSDAIAAAGLLLIVLVLLFLIMKTANPYQGLAS